MIIQDYSEHIESFKVYLEDKLSSIDSVHSNNDNVLFKKLLYVSFLDSISSCVYPKRQNRDRFITMLSRFSQWRDRDRISLPHLARFVQLSSDPLLEDARQYVNPIIEGWQHRNRKILISEDPLMDDKLKSINWKKNADYGILLSLDDFKHSNLLYQLRNALVHQFQSTGNEMKNSMIEIEEPFYQVVHTFDENHSFKPLRFELVYPVNFLKNLVNTTLNNVIEYLKKGNINPFPHYYAGNYWITKLN